VPQSYSAANFSGVLLRKINASLPLKTEQIFGYPIHAAVDPIHAALASWPVFAGRTISILRRE
jgi:hypothetical protein